MEQQKLPNSTAVLILGIASIVTCCCYGIVGLIVGIIGLSLYKKDNLLYQQNPGQYSDFNNLNTGRILCIIGIILSALYIIITVATYSYLGWDTFGNQELLMEKIKEMQNR